MTDEAWTAAVQAVARKLPWVGALPADVRDQFAADFTRAFRTSAERDDWTLLAHTLHEWRATADIHADPELTTHLSTPLDGAERGTQGA